MVDPLYMTRASFTGLPHSHPGSATAGEGVNTSLPALSLRGAKQTLPHAFVLFVGDFAPGVPLLQNVKGGG